MQRSIESIQGQQFDLLVVGGGIHGAFVAWDATLRGLSVAVVEQADFGHATSANSLKTIHGGLRYLQELNLPLVRSMINERKMWMRIAPHLVRPLPVLMPTTNKMMRSRLALGTAVRLNDLFGYDRNAGIQPERHIPSSRLINLETAESLVPSISQNKPAPNGAVIWHDGQILNTERLLLSVVSAAVERGACALNYARVTHLNFDPQAKLTGATIHDRLTDATINISAKTVVNCAGAWLDRLLEGDVEKRFTLSTAMNIVTRQIIPNYAVGLPSSYSGTDKHGRPVQKSRTLFIAPWHQFSLIGTIHRRATPQTAAFQSSMVNELIDEVNSALPAANLTSGDVYHIHWGYLPMEPAADKSDTVPLLRRGRVHQHAQDASGWPGLYSVLGVKYTTARKVAEHAIDQVIEYLGLTARSKTAVTPLIGTGKKTSAGQIKEIKAKATQLRLSAAATQHIMQNYGDYSDRLLNLVAANQALGDSVSDRWPVIAAELVYAVRFEMAHTLADVVLRRTPLGAAGMPQRSDGTVDRDRLQQWSHIVGHEAGWTADKQATEVDALIAQVLAYNPIQPTHHQAGIHLEDPKLKQEV